MKAPIREVSKVFICNGSGVGKSTLLKNIKSLYPNSNVNTDTSARLTRQVKDKSDFNATQTAKIQGIWLAHCNNSMTAKPTEVYDRGIFDYLDISLRGNCPVAHEHARQRLARNIYNVDINHWRNTTIVIAPCMTLKTLRANKSNVFDGGVREKFWRGLLLEKYGKSLGTKPTDSYLLELIHDQMVESRQFIKSMAELVDQRIKDADPANKTNYKVIDVASWTTYDRLNKFFSWQSMVLPVLDNTLKGYK